HVTQGEEFDWSIEPVPGRVADHCAFERSAGWAHGESEPHLGRKTAHLSAFLHQVGRAINELHLTLHYSIARIFWADCSRSLGISCGVIPDCVTAAWRNGTSPPRVLPVWWIFGGGADAGPGCRHLRRAAETPAAGGWPDSGSPGRG